MLKTILLYGATGYSGRLIAAEAARRLATEPTFADRFRVVLAGRDRTAVASLARSLEMESRVFGLEERDDVLAQLRDVDVVLNAAGPFALTAPHLARAALGTPTPCHYVDINGEADVYMQLDDLGGSAAARRVTMVSGAGHTAAASDLLLDAALRQLRPGDDDAATYPLGAIRIAMSGVTTLSRGSLETLWRSLREQVRIVRVGNVEDGLGGFVRGHVYWHEPVGRLERTFDYETPAAALSIGTDRRTGTRIASASNLLDTLTARRTVERHGFLAHRIESYVEVGEWSRILFQAAPLLTPLAAMRAARDAVRLQLSGLPDGPTERERSEQPHVLVLEIEDRFQTRVVNWAWRTPNPYDFTARVALETAACVAAPAGGGRSIAPHRFGWQTPAQVLPPAPLTMAENDARYLRGCTLLRSESLNPEFAS